MKLKERIKSVGFWVGMISAVFLALGSFGVEIGDDTASAVINAVCSILVMFGIVSAPQSASGSAASVADELFNGENAAGASDATKTETETSKSDAAARSDGNA
ncbi:MAG: phage holin family protein [Roseburia sp.]|nr:phage holin family protein [Roseburia sp.]